MGWLVAVVSAETMFKLGLTLGAVGFGLGVALILEVDGVWRRHRAARRRTLTAEWYGSMTDTEAQPTTECSCPGYPFELSRDCPVHVELPSPAVEGGTE